nr:leucine-rich repeat domain-containing protein [uncultured Ruminococcus sp.]
MKKLLAIMLTLVMAISIIAIIPTASGATIYKANNFEYIKLGGNKARVTAYIGKNTTVVVPSKLDNNTVTEIGNNILRYNRNVKSVSFPNSVKKFVQLPLYGAKKLEKVTIGKGITKIPNCFFEDCKAMKTYTIPSHIESIGIGVFPDTLQSLTVGKSLKKFDEVPTLNNRNFKEFKVSRNNKYFSSRDGVLYNKNKTKIVAYPNGKKTTQITIPKKVNTIGELSFAYQRYLKKVTFSKDVKKIDKMAFLNCEKLSSINIPINITTINRMAFAGCKSVSKLTINSNKKLSIGYGAFSELNKLKSLQVPVVKGNNVFSECKNLNYIYIPSNVKTIYAYEFVDCPKLKTVTIPKTVKRIGKNSLGYCHGEYYDPEYVKVKGFTIRGYKGSAGEKYAKQNGFKFVKIG